MTGKCEEACALRRSQAPPHDSGDGKPYVVLLHCASLQCWRRQGPVLPECRVGSDVGQALGVPCHVCVEDPEVGPSG